jgi:hypothetical protein
MKITGDKKSRDTVPLNQGVIKVERNPALKQGESIA